MDVIHTDCCASCLFVRLCVFECVVVRLKILCSRIWEISCNEQHTTNVGSMQSQAKYRDSLLNNSVNLSTASSTSSTMFNFIMFNCKRLYKSAVLIHKHSISWCIVCVCLCWLDHTPFKITAYHENL